MCIKGTSALLKYGYTTKGGKKEVKKLPYSKALVTDGSTVSTRDGRENECCMPTRS